MRFTFDVIRNMKVFAIGRLTQTRALRSKSKYQQLNKQNSKQEITNNNSNSNC